MLKQALEKLQVENNDLRKRLEGSNHELSKINDILEELKEDSESDSDQEEANGEIEQKIPPIQSDIDAELDHLSEIDVMIA